MIELAVEDRGRAINVTLQRTMEVRLDQFPDEAVIEHLLERGYAVDGVRKTPVFVERRVHIDTEGGNELVVVEHDVLDRIRTLAILGRRPEALELVAEVVSQEAGIRL